MFPGDYFDNWHLCCESAVMGDDWPVYVHMAGVRQSFVQRAKRKILCYFSESACVSCLWLYMSRKTIF